MRLPRILFFSCYHFFSDCAIVLTMKQIQSEIVIIPHPNEQKKIADLQKKLLQAAAEKKDLQDSITEEKISSAGIWIPTFPLYVRGFTDRKNPDDGIADLTDWKKSLRECMLTEVRADGERIMLKAEIVTTTGKKITANLKLAEQIKIGQEKSNVRQSAVTAAGKAFGFDMTGNLPLPLRLAVFRLAQVEFTCTESRREWKVENSVWVKTEMHR